MVGKRAGRNVPQLENCADSDPTLPGLDNDVINDIRQAITQNQPLGNSRFYTKIEAMVGLRREPKSRGRPKKQKDDKSEDNFNQGELPL
jgi:putative transposase